MPTSNSSHSKGATLPSDYPLPLVCEISPGELSKERMLPEAVFQHLSDLPHPLFLDSAQPDAKLARYSFVAVDPFAYREIASDAIATEAHALFAELDAWLKRYKSATVPHLPPFQGGIAGLFSYDLARSIEQIPPPRQDSFKTPALAVGLYDVVIAFDRMAHRAWILSHGFPEEDLEARQERAEARLLQMREWLQGEKSALHEKPIDRSGNILSLEELAPQHAVSSFPGITSNLSEPEYLAMIARAIEYIYAGDIFQVNLAHRLLHRAEEEPVALYMRLRESNPAPFAGYFDTGDFQVISASPERLVRVIDRKVEARPIKGTCARIPLPEADLFAGDNLRASEKDRAENIMIVDLLRNDLSKCCLPESLHVSQLCQLETFEYVQHLVSVIEGELAPGKTNLDLLRALFPGGSITGAPKIRAMEIIAEQEPTARGAYCGSLGYLGFDGSIDLSILIRTITAGRGWWQIPVGGGIVARSTPPLEYEETWQKAEGMLKALKP